MPKELSIKQDDSTIVKSEHEHYVDIIDELGGAVSRLRYLVSLVPNDNIREIDEEYDINLTICKTTEKINTICNFIAFDYEG